MHVHRVATGEELFPVLEADVNAYAKANGAPDTVTATDPACKAEHVLLVDTELRHFFLIRGQSDKVFGDVRLALGCLEEP